MTIFEINPDIRKASTLSSEFYTDEKYFEQSKEKIFARTWHYICTSKELNNLKPVNILDTPLVIAKDGENINCFSNVCTHRGAILVEKECVANGIRCRYHGRRFDLQGKFLSMPEFENVENFPSEKDNLTKVLLGFWDNFIFASLQNQLSLDSFLDEMKERVQLSANLKLTATKDYEVNAHWALYCENYLEGFHVPFVHPALNNEIDYGLIRLNFFVIQICKLPSIATVNLPHCTFLFSRI